MKRISTQCCVVGGGPAGIMLGFLLARSGIDAIIMEKWPDFFRDFRGDTIHPITMEILHELGLLDDFLKLPHNETHQLSANINGHPVTIADFSKLPVHSRFIAFVPQWDFLNFVAEKGKKYPGFHLMMNTECTDLIEEDGKVAGARVIDKSTGETCEIRAPLTIGADGRHSTVREKSNLLVEDLGAPMDVLWFRVSRKPTDMIQFLGKFNQGRLLVMIERGDYWQCGFIIRKGDYDKIRQAGIEPFRQELGATEPILIERSKELTSWDQIKYLEVRVDHLNTWHRPGLLCIGDSAHAMSPIGGVGVNLAVQDAVASANILVPALLDGTLSEATLAAVQKRRLLPTKIIQHLQVLAQNKIIGKVLGLKKTDGLPWILKCFNKFPFLRRFPARLIGLGFRPEHVKTKEADVIKIS